MSDMLESGSNSRIKRSTQTLLITEYIERLRLLTFGRYFGRLVFTALLCVAAIAGKNEIGFGGAVSIASIIFGAFWFFEEFFQYNAMLRLQHAIAAFEEKTSPKYWQDNYIRYQYSRMYNFQDRMLRSLGMIEPIIWMAATVSLFPHLLHALGLNS